MSDENIFDKQIQNVKKILEKQGIKFLIIDSEYGIRDPKNPKQFCYIDNIVQINNLLFIFEGKSKAEEEGESQLRKYLGILRDHYFKNVKEGFFFPYDLNSIRVFYYTIKRHEIIEFVYKGRSFIRYPKKWKDLKELQIILQNIFKGQKP